MNPGGDTSVVFWGDATKICEIINLLMHFACHRIIALCVCYEPEMS